MRNEETTYLDLCLDCKIELIVGFFSLNFPISKGVLFVLQACSTLGKELQLPEGRWTVRGYER